MWIHTDDNWTDGFDHPSQICGHEQAWLRMSERREDPVDLFGRDIAFLVSEDGVAVAVEVIEDLIRGT